MRLLSLLLAVLLVPAALGQSVHVHTLPFVLSADSLQRTSLVRILNLPGRGGTVRIYATDDTGEPFGPVDLDLAVGQSLQFTSQDLEQGNAKKGLLQGVGDGEGHWWLELHTTLDIKALAYVRTHDGFLTSMHDVVHEDEASHFVPFFNPASNQSLRSFLRIVNTSEQTEFITITGRDAAAREGVEAVTFWLPAGESVSMDAQRLEEDFGDGTGKWTLTVETSYGFVREKPVWVMNLLQTRSGHLANLSTEGGEPGVAPPPSGTPPRPTHFRLLNNFISEHVILQWWPYPSGYTDHATTHIYRSTSNDFTTSQKVGGVSGDGWSEAYPSVSRPQRFWYWIRWESRSGLLGPESPAESVLVSR